VTVLPYPLPLDATTPVTEAIENGTDEGVRSINDISRELQSAIAIATKGGPTGEYVTQVSRLGMSVLRGVVSAWSTAIDGLGLIAADSVEWWWTGELTLHFPTIAHVPRGVVRPSVAPVVIGPQRRDVPGQWVRVAHHPGGNEFNFIDRGAGVPGNWDRSCYVTVRQHEDFIPTAVVVTVEMFDTVSQQQVTSDPVDAILSLSRSR
jgi:hypothetical protein